jgi:GNAT superfamily N-acetyltransferase
VTLQGRLRSGVGDEAAVRALLNEAYDNWGDEEYFRWKYNDYPDYQPDEHVLSIVVDDELAAFRRIFERELTVQGETVPIHIYGDTAVAPKYQGWGLYSELYERTKEYSLQSGATYGAAYNRKGNVTFDIHRDQGWAYRTLPLQLRILSPKKVLETYASLITKGVPAIDSVANAVGHRFHIGTSEGKLTLKEIVHGSGGSTKHSIGPTLTDTAVTSYVEAVSTDGNTIADLATTSARLAVTGQISVDQSTNSNSGRRAFVTGDLNISIEQTVSEAELNELVDLYGERPSFRRMRDDIRHITGYPDSDVLIVRRDGVVVGYAVLGPRENDRVVEGRVLEIQTENGDKDVFRVLMDRLEERAIERGFDLVLVLSDEALGDQWAAVDQQVLIWDELGQTKNHPLRHDNLKITLYDVF